MESKNHSWNAKENHVEPSLPNVRTSRYISRLPTRFFFFTTATGWIHTLGQQISASASSAVRSLPCWRWQLPNKKTSKKTDVLLMVQKSCRVEVVLLSGGCCFFSPDFFWSRNHSREEVWPPWKTNMAMKDPTIWRCTSYEKIMMFHSHVSFPGCSGVTILLEKPNRKKHKNQKKHFYFNASLQFQSNFHRWNKRQRWLADGPMEKSRSIFVNHKPLGKVTKCLDFQVWKKTTDLKPWQISDFLPNPSGFLVMIMRKAFLQGKTAQRFPVLTSSPPGITVGRSVLGSWIAIPQSVDLAKHEDFIAGLSGPAPC